MTPRQYACRLSALLVLSGGLITGCTVGPDFHSPTLPDNASYQKGALLNHTVSASPKGGATQTLVSADNIRGNWYGLFHSPALDGLITEALQHSPTIKAGQARLAAASEAVRIAYGGTLPQLDAGIDVSRNRLSGVEFGIHDPAFQNTYMLYKGQLSLGYDVDLFGKHRRNIEGQKALYRAKQYRLLNTSLTLVDNVVATALNEAGLRASTDALKHIIRAQTDAFNVISNKEKYGAATMADTARARALLSATKARLPELKKQLQLARDRLALLTGHTPGDFDDPHIILDALQLPKKLPVALPSQLVARRPDILAANNRLHWANARIGV
ncbi:MAG: efflux transporter outer membrane subunit, partial [Sinobacteraceae bacterium]|nr:efflux transporter outer membrane subunit [Nevskiaceae bacterium]